MRDLTKDARGYVKDAREFRTKLSNGYTLILSPGSISGQYFQDSEYWATEDGLTICHDAFSNYIKDFGLPRKEDRIMDAEGEIMTVYKVFVGYVGGMMGIEIEFT